MQIKRAKWHYLFSLLFFVYSTITVLLFVVILMSSFKGNKSEANIINIWKLPEHFTFINYKILMVKDLFYQYTLNSLIITIVSTVSVVYIASLAAYGLGRFQFKGKNILYYYFMVGLMFPIQLGVVPLFILIRNLGLKNTIFSIILIYTANLSMPVFVLTGYVNTIPVSIIEASKIDGAGEARLFHTIMIPLMKPIFAALAPLLIIFTWNDFFIPLVFLTKDSCKTIPLGLMKYYIGQFFNGEKWNLVFTSAAVSILPILILYIVSSNKIISGITSGAVK
jgi:ABC-type sugar transport system, permease component